ncbi:MAG: succinylglutamate desuccinylase/aspartoacylase family protein [Methanobacterium sp.]|nr:succinylglutamate desuccinylase/aspartoacylase family protein [Methanobacterium sp.]
MVHKDNIIILSDKTGGILDKNKNFMAYVPDADICNQLVDSAQYGTPMLKIGCSSPKIMISAGVHGNELPAQIAALTLIKELYDKNINGTVYIIPFTIPTATMENSRRFNGFDMNRSASKEGSITNKILNTMDNLSIVAVADFHSTKPRSNPGIESVFCSKSPCAESYFIAKYITNIMSSKIICHPIAGFLYSGAIEDESNNRGIAAVTCEVLSENCVITKGSLERSYLQMIYYLKYFGII